MDPPPFLAISCTWAWHIPTRWRIIWGTRGNDTYDTCHMGEGFSFISFFQSRWVDSSLHGMGSLSRIFQHKEGSIVFKMQTSGVTFMRFNYVMFFTMLQMHLLSSAICERWSPYYSHFTISRSQSLAWLPGHAYILRNQTDSPDFSQENPVNKVSCVKSYLTQQNS